MADELDLTAERDEVLNAARLENIRKAAQLMPKGVPGECQACGEDMPRLVGGICCFCRDKGKLP